MTPKQFYNNYQADQTIDALDIELVRQVLSFEPESVLEFGMGSGKNLRLIKEARPETETWGVDISIVNVFQAHCNGVDCVTRGDERHLPLRKFDVVLTCSVLDHIKDIDNIIGHFQQIATKAIILAETNSFRKAFYWPHNYRKLGFKDTGFRHVSDGDGGLYKIWLSTPEQIAKLGCVD